MTETTKGGIIVAYPTRDCVKCGVTRKITDFKVEKSSGERQNICRFHKGRHQVELSTQADPSMTPPVCDICNEKERIPGKELVLYGNKVGKRSTRGRLCFLCNSGLEMFRDNPRLLLQAAIFLIPDESIRIHQVARARIKG